MVVGSWASCVFNTPVAKCIAHIMCQKISSFLCFRWMKSLPFLLRRSFFRHRFFRYAVKECKKEKKSKKIEATAQPVKSLNSSPSIHILRRTDTLNRRAQAKKVTGVHSKLYRFAMAIYQHASTSSKINKYLHTQRETNVRNVRISLMFAFVSIEEKKILSGWNGFL